MSPPAARHISRAVPPLAAWKSGSEKWKVNPWDFAAGDVTTRRLLATANKHVGGGLCLCRFMRVQADHAAAAHTNTRIQVHQQKHNRHLDLTRFRLHVYLLKLLY